MSGLTSQRNLSAMGHLQFLPSVFKRYAVDGDGDGKHDLRGSIPDAMASAGNFLNKLGWKTGLRWGREIRLPEGFDYSIAGRDQHRPLADWVDLGITDAYGGPLTRPPADGHPDDESLKAVRKAASL